MRRTASTRAANSASRKIHNSFGDMKDHAAGMKDDVRDIADAVKDAVKGVVIEKFTDMLKRATTFGARSQEAAREAVDNAREDIEERIQEHPYRTILIGIGVGLALGFFLRGK
jgi:ElaB/YqjD/DUF883 family membrane-anchored ribosome-binding protein